MVIPFSQPIKSSDGRTELKEVFVPKGTTVHINIAATSRSRALWGDDAKEFKPERWLKADGPGYAVPTSIISRMPGVGFSSGM